ncbi:hypothetical protein CK203_043886 [Vitis vinifera]|uniref:Uncharacterized protein n=1 Tax=Vitis vinifera TaxID=29760 RepID=A0A438HVG6_VITVI|nr:hypothetical protein CK203_043886 [Vitis vinifera]
MEEAKTMKTPMSSSIKLDKDEKGKSIDSTMYRGMIEDYQRYKQKFAQRNVVLGEVSISPNCNISGLHMDLVTRLYPPLEVLRFNWTQRASAIFLDIALVGLKVYESKVWPIVPSFELRKIHLGYLMMMHKISFYESTTHVLPYGSFLTRVFKDVEVDLSRETNFEIRRAERPTTHARGQGQVHPGVEEKAEIREMEETSPHQTPHAPDHAPWMDLSAQISSLGTRMEELVVVSDTRFYSMEDHMDQYKTGFTSQFEYM